MTWNYKGSRLFYDEDELGGRRIAVAAVPDTLRITDVQELVRVTAEPRMPERVEDAIPRTFYFDPLTGQLWEDS